MINLNLNDNWTFNKVGDDKLYKATVPGSLYGDLLDNGLMENPYWKDNEIAALELMDFDYEYKKSFDVSTEIFNQEEVLLHFDGLDTIADIYFNDEFIGHVMNMHRIYEFSIKDRLRLSDNNLRIVFHSPTRYIDEAFNKAPTLGTEDAMNGFVHIRKAHYMFGWDWGAHLPDMGIWRDVSLVAFSEIRLKDALILQYHKDDEVQIVINPELVFLNINTDYSLQYELIDPNGNSIEYTDNKITVTSPQLWWPNGFGKQNLYTVIVKLFVNGNIIETIKKRIGLRVITVDRSKDKWGEKFAMCVNGINIFAMGADYIPEDHLLSRVNKETTRKLLNKALLANFNSIRVWGGGHYPSDDFYDLCDEMGLIVWQDFMFACAVYDLTPEFEENIRGEFIDNIKRLRHHASLGLMCGNNEMEEFVSVRNWVTKESEVTDYLKMYEEIIPSYMKELAPQVFYWPASPSSGGGFDNPQDPNRGDVHYWDVWHGNKPFSEYRKFYFRYLSEFGFQSFPSKKTIETFTDDEKDMNIFSYIMERHQRNGSANGKIMNYMQQTYKYPTDFETLIYASQLLQADAIRYGVEHFRRNRNDDRCMGAIYWQFNDCWPVASWSSVDYEGRLKALHYYARRFFAPLLISVEEKGMLGSNQELVRLPFDFEKSIRLCVSNETLKDRDVTVNWQLRNSSSRIIRSESVDINVKALSSYWLTKETFMDIDIYSEYVSYELVYEGEVVSSGTVIFSLPKYFKYEDPELSYEINGDEITIRASKYAASVEIKNANDNLLLSDNYFDMNKGSRTIKVLSGNTEDIRLRSVYDIH